MNDQFWDKLSNAMTDLNIGWTCHEQARQMAGEIFRLRPEVSVEIGVYGGKGCIALALAHKWMGYGKVIGIDPWLPDTGQKTLEFSDVEHCETVYQKCLENIKKYDVQDFVQIIRAKSDDVDPPKKIGFIRIDGDHGASAIRDVKRFCPNVVTGGCLHLDDMNWENGAEQNGAQEWLKANGFTEAYNIDTGLAFRKV